MAAVASLTILMPLACVCASTASPRDLASIRDTLLLLQALGFVLATQDHVAAHELVPH
jgi:hypothetical protein